MTTATGARRKVRIRGYLPKLPGWSITMGFGIAVQKWERLGGMVNYFY